MAEICCFLPDVVQYESGAFSTSLTADLKRRGHSLKQLNRRYGNMNAILLNRRNGHVTGIAVKRGEGGILSTLNSGTTGTSH